MMCKNDWEEVLKAWENVKKQAEVSLEQAGYFIPIIEDKIKNISNAQDI